MAVLLQNVHHSFREGASLQLQGTGLVSCVDCDEALGGSWVSAVVSVLEPQGVGDKFDLVLI